MVRFVEWGRRGAGKKGEKRRGRGGLHVWNVLFIKKAILPVWYFRWLSVRSIGLFNCIVSLE